MNSINGIARGDSPCAIVPPSLAPESEHYGRAPPASMAVAERTQMCTAGEEFGALMFAHRINESH